MAYFEWASDLVIDGGRIDQDHMHLVDLVNQLHTATTDGVGQEVVMKIMQQLVTYTMEHFTREEQTMAAARFPGLKQHQASHQQFISDLDVLIRQFASGSISVAAQLSALLRDWLSLHIRRSDREFRVYMTRIGRL